MIYRDDTFRRVKSFDEQEEERRERMRHFEGPGGTPGGLGAFLLGLAMAIAGGYLIMSRVQVTSGFWYWRGTNMFGLTLIPLMIGVGLLFFNGRSITGWLLAGASAVVIFAGILANLEIYFAQTSLFSTILMLVLFAGGLGLMARSLKRT